MKGERRYASDSISDGQTDLKPLHVAQRGIRDIIIIITIVVEQLIVTLYEKKRWRGSLRSHTSWSRETGESTLVAGPRLACFTAVI